MLKIGLVYFSNTDVTGELMGAINDQLLGLGCSVIKHRISGSEIINGRFERPALFQELHSCHAIIFGSPTYMGGVSAQFKTFADATSDFWESQTWAGKLAAGVTSGTGLNGDQGHTLSYMQLLASQHGMLWVSLDAPFNDAEKGVNRLGCHMGVTAHSTTGKVCELDIKTANYLANKIVGYAIRFSAET
ncbi:MAG TPA: flavodoxin family protein [Pseudomonas sp.]|nr:flavodoxin family protein [Pseudomonas sp.]